jgi:hypothetical protein
MWEIFLQCHTDGDALKGRETMEVPNATKIIIVVLHLLLHLEECWTPSVNLQPSLFSDKILPQKWI